MQSHRRIWVISLVCLMGLAFLLSSRRTLGLLSSMIATTATTTGRSSRSSKPRQITKGDSWQRFQENRSLALIHIGKAGGLTLRAMTSLKCRLPRDQATDESIRNCLSDSFGSTDESANPLTLQTKHYAHMNSIPHKELEQATSWLLSLRNPVERVISAYRYSHPANCQDKLMQANSTKGCTNRYILRQSTLSSRPKRRNQIKMEQQLSKLFVECFPEASVESFAQMAAASQPRSSMEASASDEECSQLARAYIAGKGPLFPIPHLQYNYQHYWKKALEPHETPDKEWFGVRTEHLWEDFQALNTQLGAAPPSETAQTNHLHPIKLTHGSENFHAASLSPMSYQLLCCLLRDEISVYLEIITRLWNLSDDEKYHTVQDLARKCGVTVHGVDSQLAEKSVGIWGRLANLTCQAH